ncbi:MAG: hypothetical protein AB8F78_02755 [Saprospiraceae bacterium]
MRSLLLLSLCCVIGVLAKAQNPYAFNVDSTYHDSLHLPVFQASANTLAEYETKLNASGTLLLRSRDASLRAAAADTVLNALQRALLLQDAVDYPWSELTTISKQAPSSEAWRIFTWQHFVNDSTYRYLGVLQQKKSPETLYILQDSAQALGLEREYELRPDQWYGALYYGVQPFKTNKGKDAWVLFGYDADAYTHRRKVADILTFSKAGKPLFGKEVFVGTEQDSSRRLARLILEYRVDSRVGLRYNPDLGGISFDRLVTGPPVRKGGPPSYIPDGSYDGYVYHAKSGEWRWRMEWFDRVISTEAPRPQPIFGTKERKDVFGRPSKPRG